MKLPDAREAIAFLIVALFAWGFIKNPHEPLIVGALIAAFSTAYGFYLGGSKVGADTATKNADALASQAASEPQAVTVTNDPSNPVPVEPRP